MFLTLHAVLFRFVVCVFQNVVLKPVLQLKLHINVLFSSLK